MAKKEKNGFPKFNIMAMLPQIIEMVQKPEKGLSLVDDYTAKALIYLGNYYNTDIHFAIFIAEYEGKLTTMIGIVDAVDVKYLEKPFPITELISFVKSLTEKKQIAENQLLETNILKK